MIARLSGASFGLFAFAITVVSGLLVGNPVTVTLSRSILALFVFCLIGLTLGTAAQMVIAEHARRREGDIRKRYGDGHTTKQAEQEAPPDEQAVASVGA